MASRNVLNALLTDESGATAVEYGLILALIVLAVMASIISLASGTTKVWNNVATKTANAVNGS